MTFLRSKFMFIFSALITMIVCFKRLFWIFMIHTRFSKNHNVLFLQYKTGNFSGLILTTLLIYTTGAEELTPSRADPNFAGPLFLWPNFQHITTLNSVRTIPLGDKFKTRPIRPHSSILVKQLIYRVKLYFISPLLS